MATSGKDVAAGNATKQSVNITSLPLEQLTRIRQQLADETQVYTSNLVTLRAAAAKFGQAKLAIEQAYGSGISGGDDDDDEQSDREIFVPLTSSMYIPGTLSSKRTVLVDVGTGYFLEKSAESAKEYFANRVQELHESTNKIADIIRQKRMEHDIVTQVVQEKQQLVHETQAREMEKLDDLKVAS